jgi:diacylglycerol O-acyltransferase
MHHAIADGGASVRILEEVFGAIEPTGAGDGRGDEREPTKSRLVAFAIRTQVKQWRQLPSMVARTLSSLRSGRAREKAGAAAVTRPLSGPSTRFNQPLTPNRAYVDVTVSMGELKAVKDALGATLNDVYIAICGGALRRYLQDRGELPSGDLTATSPVSLRGDDELHTYGNRISYWYVTLAPDDDDPVTRLRRVSERTSAARDFAQGDRGLFSDWQNFYVLFRFLSLTLLSMAERRMGKPAFNAIVSNVRGPRPLSFEGAPVVAVRSMGPIVGLEGLNFTAWSYGGNLSIGIHACREHAPDLRDLATHIRTELDTLTEAAKLLSTSS